MSYQLNQEHITKELKMEKTIVKNIITNTNKGAIKSVTFGRELKTLKSVTAKVEKVTTMSARFGITYDNIKNVQTARENGTLPKENQGLPWGEWSEYPYFITHKGVEYMRLYTTHSNNKTVTRYFVDGKEVDKETAKALCLKSEFSDNSKPMEVVTVKVENIQNIK